MSKKKKINYKNWIIIIQFAMIFALAIYVFLIPKYKIGFVRSQELIYQFEGMKDSHTMYESTVTGWQNEVDSLKVICDRKVVNLQDSMALLSEEEINYRKRIIQNLEDGINRSYQYYTEEAATLDQEMTAAVLNQVNTFTKEYGENYNYDLIIGTSGGGNLLFGDSTLDITEEILEKMNNHYLDVE
jgi:outer membrane protein